MPKSAAGIVDFQLADIHQTKFLANRAQTVQTAPPRTTTKPKTTHQYSCVYA
ncbi:hypothetical protein [Moraxella catarrhalis]|uniref:Uncharacterized protein n=1 Tax=Moraxella catarrhalis TaxID=480 RepID=A0A198UGE2_MORCA|nr:hypothetical protein [Moraxella catarrhalis]OAU95415.1 hypothetical protein AO384_1606 [Moraxella catarrhalis]OAU98204.1 hypothetical protein AO383_0660 [Moraxella catarrhalis]OAV02784.1 hypothetical protein AO385_0854 [Moraxella catarrhalis]